MLDAAPVLVLSLAYLGLLFAIASWGDRRADSGRSVIGSPWIYTLSLAVYCTAWTFYGSVGLRRQSGLAFLPVFLGPTIGALMFAFLLHKVVRIAKAYGITSIADFIAARFGKSGLLGGLVTVVAGIGAIPYISLQLKAVSASIGVVMGPSGHAAFDALGVDTALIVTLVMAAFAILFGTRHIDATENHQGMVLAVAFESLVKLLTFLIAGLFIVYSLLVGPGVAEPGVRLGPRSSADHERLRLRLRRLVPADAVVGCRLLRAAAAVPGGGDRECRRGPHPPRQLGAAALSAGHQPVRAADRPWRRARHRPRRRHAGADAGGGDRPAVAGAAGLSGRAVGGDGDDHRRDRGVEHDDLERPGDARAVALAGAGAEPPRRPDLAGAVGAARRHPVAAAARLWVLPSRR